MGSGKTGESDDANQTLLIGDDLLIEILSRISTPVVAIRCKLVCRNWCSLISSHYFMSRFKQQHIEHESRYPKPLSGMLASTVRRIISMENPDDCEFNFRGFNLDYLPKKNGKIDVLASCNDLILCRAPCNYYLCNPFTMQWVALPRPPSHPSEHYIIKTGLVCESGGGGTIDDRLRYRIVRFHTHSKDRPQVVEMYCSQISEWIQCDDLDEEYYWYESTIAAYNGKLYWVNGDCQYLTTYDPFNMRQTSVRLIDGPNSDDDLWNGHHCHVGECKGVLRVVRLEPLQPGASFEAISVWELQEGEAVFKEHIVFNEDIRRSHQLSNQSVVGIHAMNKDVVYLRMSNDILGSFNIKTRELKFESRFITRTYSDQYAFPLQLPWWPTLIPSPSPVL